MKIRNKRTDEKGGFGKKKADLPYDGNLRYMCGCKKVEGKKLCPDHGRV